MEDPSKKSEDKITQATNILNEALKKIEKERIVSTDYFRASYKPFSEMQKRTVIYFELPGPVPGPYDFSQACGGGKIHMYLSAPVTRESNDEESKYEESKCEEPKDKPHKKHNTNKLITKDNFYICPKCNKKVTQVNQGVDTYYCLDCKELAPDQDCLIPCRYCKSPKIKWNYSELGTCSKHRDKYIKLKDCDITCGIFGDQ